MGGCYSAIAATKLKMLRRGGRGAAAIIPVTSRDGGPRCSPERDSDAKERRRKGRKHAPILGDPGAVDPDFARRYRLGAELGRGEFGMTRRCEDAATGEALACKTIRRKRLMAGRGRKGFRRGAAGSGWPAAGGGGRSAHASCRPAAWSDGHGPETRRGAPPSSRPRAPGRHGREQQHRAGRGRRALATHASSPAEATSSGARPTAHASSPAVGGEQRPASHACLRDGRGRGVATVRAIW